MTLHEIITRFDAKRVGKEWLAICPAHEDHSPSLAISEGDNGCVLMKCRAGCPTEKVLAQKGLKMTDLFLEKTNKTRPVTPPEKRNGKLHPDVNSAINAAKWFTCQTSGTDHKQTGKWPYHNATREIVAYVIRFDPVNAVPDENGKTKKRFVPIHRDGDGWRVGDPPGLWPLYSLTEISKSSEIVFVVEGEKAAEAGKCVGIICSTSAHGSQSPNKTDWKSLTGRDVVILPDNDDSGIKYVELVSEHLRGVANSVCVIKLPGLPKKGDLYDFVKARENKDTEIIKSELYELIKKPPKEQEKEFLIPPKPEIKKGGIIVLPGGSKSITEAAEFLFEKIAPTHQLFTRGGLVMELRHDDGKGLRLDVMKAQSFRSRIEKMGMLFAWRAGRGGEPVLKSTVCPSDTAEALLACQAAEEILPTVRGLSACPVIVEIDGQPQVLGKGYHPANGGLLITAGEKPPDMPLEEAVTALKLLVEEFDFSTSSDRSRALASFITPALRVGGWLRGNIAIDMAEANDSQAGKGYRQNLIFAVYNERPSLVAIKNGGVGGLDESVSQALIYGRPFIQLDNIRGKLDSQFLEMMMTAGGMISARIPQKAEVLVDSRHFIIMMTSNGVETTPDLANRSSLIRILKREGFNYKTFPEGDLLDNVKANQPYFLSAIFAIIKAWHSAGKLRTTDTIHDFREWAQTLGWIVENILGEAPLMSGHRQAQQRVSNPALTWLRKVAIAVEKDNRLNEEMMASDIAELCEGHSIEIAGLRELSDETGRNKRVGILIRKSFGDLLEISIDRFKIRKNEKPHFYESEQRFQNLKVYTFSVILPESPVLPGLEEKTP